MVSADVLSQLMPSVCDLAVTAGKAILQVAEEGTEVESKADGSPLTRADRASHNVIDAGLRTLSPTFPVLSEEGDLEIHDPSAWSVYWCVDPLDGTKEFVKGLSEYTVNIALIEDAVPILGVVYVPVQDVLYYASRDQGAWKRTGGGDPVRIAPSTRKRPVNAVASRSHLSDETRAFLDRLGITDVVQHGSSLKICAIAEGVADVYPRHGPTCLWDTAAGAAVVIESGCEITDLDGAPLRYDPSAGLKQAGFLVYPKGMDLS